MWCSGGFGGSQAGLGEQSGERLLAGARPEVVDVDTGRNEVRPVEPRPGAEHLGDHPTDVVRSRDDGLRRFEGLPCPPAQLVVPAQRELELRAVCLHDIRHAGRGAHRAAEDQVVGEEEIGRQVLSQGRGIRLHEALALVPAEILDAMGLDVLVAIDDEHGQDPPDVGPDDAGAPDVVPLRMGILAEDDHLVALP